MLFLTQITTSWLVLITMQTTFTSTFITMMFLLQLITRGIIYRKLLQNNTHRIWIKQQSWSMDKLSDYMVWASAQNTFLLNKHQSSKFSYVQNISYAKLIILVKSRGCPKTKGVQKHEVITVLTSLIFFPTYYRKRYVT